MDYKQKTEMLAVLACSFGGTSKNATITKKVGSVAKYTYTKYWFDFHANVKLEDKLNVDKLKAPADIQLRIDDNLLVITARTRCGILKVLTQMNGTRVMFIDGVFVVDSVSVHLEVSTIAK